MAEDNDLHLPTERPEEEDVEPNPLPKDKDRSQAMERLEEEDAISLLDLLLVFARHKKKILIIPLIEILQLL